jgi:hypothetical protein
VDITSNPPQTFAAGSDLIFPVLSGLMNINPCKTGASANKSTQISEKKYKEFEIIGQVVPETSELSQ